jgi:hypothetical protein
MIEDISVSIVKSPEIVWRMRGALVLIVPSKSRSGGAVAEILNQPGRTVRLKVEPPEGSITIHRLPNVELLNSWLKPVESDPIEFVPAL